MKNLNELNEYRKPLNGIIGDETCGNFIIPSANERFKYHVIASSDMGWEHVSVSLITINELHQIERCPRWNEMCFIKNLFFNEDETVLQYHPAKKDYVNIHPYVLHLWRPLEQDIPKPPTIMM